MNYNPRREELEAFEELWTLDAREPFEDREERLEELEGEDLE